MDNNPEQPQQPRPLLPENWAQAQLTEEEQKAIAVLMTAPLLRKFFQSLYFTSIEEVAINEAETPEQEKKLIARFNKLRGVHYVCLMVLNGFPLTKETKKT